MDITDLPVAATIDPVNDVLPIVTLNLDATQKINRNTLLGLSSAPVGLTDTQTLTNKTLTSPTVSGPTLSGTISGTYTLGGTPTFPSSIVTLTGTQTLTNKTLTSPAISSPTITNATLSADTITGYTDSDTGTVYGISVTNGVVGSAALQSGSITYSKLGTDSSWAWQSWTPTHTGFSANPTVVGSYTQIGKTVICNYRTSSNGTSNATSYTVSAPVTAKTQSNALWLALAQVIDSGTTQTSAGLAFISSGGTSITVTKTLTASSSFTASGNKGSNWLLIYEAA